MPCSNGCNTENSSGTPGITWESGRDIPLDLSISITQAPSRFAAPQKPAEHPLSHLPTTHTPAPKSRMLPETGGDFRRTLCHLLLFPARGFFDPATSTATSPGDTSTEGSRYRRQDVMCTARAKSKEATGAGRSRQLGGWAAARRGSTGAARAARPR